MFNVDSDKFFFTGFSRRLNLWILLLQLVLMKRGGRIIYAGSLGRHSQKLIEYFEVSFLHHFTTEVLPSIGSSFFCFSFDFKRITSFIMWQSIPGVSKIEEGYNPATWMLDISTPAAESQLGVDFAEIYAKSSLYQ